MTCNNVQNVTKKRMGLGRITVDIILALLIYFVCVFFLFFIMQLEITQQSIVPESLSQRFVDLLGLSAASFFLLKRYPLEEKILSFNRARGKLWLKYGLPLGCLVAIISYPYSYIHKGGTINAESFVDPQQNSILLAVFLLLTVFVTPVIEEFFLRACVFRVLKSKIKFFWATFASSCLFVLLHNISGQAQFIKLFIISLVLTFCYEFSKTVTASIIAHSIGNGIWYLAVYSHIYGITK